MITNEPIETWMDELIELADECPYSSKPTYIEPLGTFVKVAEFNNGDGHEMGFVLMHVESSRYFRVSGTYSSWDSSEWDDVREVLPVKVTVTRYQDIETQSTYEDPTL